MNEEPHAMRQSDYLTMHAMHCSTRSTCNERTLEEYSSCGVAVSRRESRSHVPIPNTCVVLTMDEQLPASSLGTKSYWDNVYDDEIHNFNEHGDIGEVWFGEGITRKVVDWILKFVVDDRTAHIVDIGCGNGHTLMLLHRKGFKNLTGVDYSEQAVALAKSIAEAEHANIEFHVRDIVQDSMPCIGSAADFVIDKGTFDAISLNPSEPIAHSRSKYINFIEQCLQPAGLFIITSCNWTKDELVSHFSDSFVLVGEIASPSLTFGGKQGNKVTTLIWRRVNEHK